MSTHGGDIARFAAIGGCLPEEITDFSVNLNPCGIPDGVFKEYFSAFDDLHRYPVFSGTLGNIRLHGSGRQWGRGAAVSSADVCKCAPGGAGGAML